MVTIEEFVPTTAAPPRPKLTVAVQALNVYLQTPPLSIVVYGVWWSLVLVGTACGAPLVLLVRLFWKLWSTKSALQPSSHHCVVITGCDSGMGKELAIWAATQGYTVFAGCLQQDRPELDGIDRLIPIQCDVTRDDHVQRLVQAVQEWLSNDKERRRLHALVNNAGVAHCGLVAWTPIDDYRKLMEVHYYGLIRCCKAFLPLLIDQSIHGYHNARILNNISVAGYLPSLHPLSAYWASKQAADAFTSGLRQELLQFRIQVCAIHPAVHDTPLLANMGPILDTRWQALSPETREMYGEEYFQTARYSVVDEPAKLRWKLQTAVGVMYNLLLVERVPGVTIVGIDAKFLLVGLRLMPGWFLDVIASAAYKIPAAMTTKL